MSTVVLIKRGDVPSEDVILKDGEMAYARKDREFYIGDGKSRMTELVPFKSLVAGDDNKVYAIRVDKDGVAHAKPVASYVKGSLLEFKISE